MKYYILDKEKEALLDEDTELLTFKDQNEAVLYLKSCEYNDDFIVKNFSILRSSKPLIPEEIPEFDKSIAEMPQSSKDKVDISLMAANRFPLQKSVKVFGTSSEMIEGLRKAYKLGISDWIERCSS